MLAPLTLFLIDKQGAFAAGVAYSTTDPRHFLNVHAGNMSAFPDAPDHFYQWLCDREDLWRALDPSFAKLTYNPQSFMPRKIYGRYLKECLKSAQALSRNCSLQLLSSEALDVAHLKNNQMEILLSTGTKIVADALVLATGVPLTKRFAQPELATYTDNIWKPPAKSLLSMPSLAHLPVDTQIVIIGSGLTMADAMMSLLSRGFKGKIAALSKHGKLSETHLDLTEAYPSFIDLATAPVTAAGLFRMFRTKLKEAQRIGWRPLLDALRPFTMALWQRLPLEEKRRFLRHLYSLWNHHRHRLPPACHQCVAAAQAQGQLTLMRGRLIKIEKGAQGVLRAHYKMAENTAGVIEADYVLNCSGQDFSFARNATPLLRRLCTLNLVAVDELGMGLRWSTQGPVFVLGALLFGERFETIAVPELRQQAADIANCLLVSTL